MKYFSAEELAQITGGILNKVEDVKVCKLMPPLLADEETLALALNEDEILNLEKTKAKIAIVPLGAAPENITSIEVERPRLAMMKLLTIFYKAPSAGNGIHPSAVVDETAKLGKNVSLGPNVVVCAGASVGDNTKILANVFVGENSKIGSDCLLHAGVNLGSNTILGDRVIINHGASIGADGFSFVTETPDNIENARKDGGEIKETNENQVIFKIPSLGGVKIGNDVEIGANACIDKGTIEYTQIGDMTKIDNLVQIGHNCKIGKACMIVSQVGIAGSCKIGDRVVIAGQAGLADHLTIGSDSIIMAQAGVSKSFPEKSLIVGTPAVPRKEFIRQLQTMKKAEQLIKKFQSYEKVLNAELPDNKE